MDFFFMEERPFSLRAFEPGDGAQKLGITKKTGVSILEGKRGLDSVGFWLEDHNFEFYYILENFMWVHVGG